MQPLPLAPHPSPRLPLRAYPLSKSLSFYFHILLFFDRYYAVPPANRSVSISSLSDLTSDKSPLYKMSRSYGFLDLFAIDTRLKIKNTTGPGRFEITNRLEMVARVFAI